MIKILRQFIFTIIAVAGLTLAVSAQKNDQKKPPKDPPPKIVPGDPGKKPPKENPPKGGPKKPEMAFFLLAKEADTAE